MFRKIFCFILVAALSFPTGAHALQGYVQAFGETGSIAWGNGELSVAIPFGEPTSEGTLAKDPLAIRRAASQARRQLLDIIMATRIDSKRTVSAFLSDSKSLANRVRGVVHNSPIKRPALFDGVGEVRVSEVFRGKLAELLLPTTIPFQSGIPPKLSTSMEQALDYDEQVPEPVGHMRVGYTGVIIDARGYKVTPCLAPVIYGQDGKGAYGAFLVSRSDAIANGIAAYATIISPATLKRRVGKRPLTVRAVSTYGSWRTDIIVTTSMGNIIRSIMAEGEAMKKCRIVIVIDKPTTDTTEVETGTLQEGSLPIQEQ